MAASTASYEDEIDRKMMSSPLISTPLLNKRAFEEEDDEEENDGVCFCFSFSFGVG